MTRPLAVKVPDHIEAQVSAARADKDDGRCEPECKHWSGAVKRCAKGNNCARATAKEE